MQRHDTRGIVASLAALTGASLLDILMSGNWAFVNTFLCHYAVCSFMKILQFIPGKKLIDGFSVSGINLNKQNVEEEEDTTRATATTAPPHLSAMATTPNGDRQKESPQVQRASVSLVLSHSSAIRRVMCILLTSQRQLARLIGVSQRDLDWH